MNLARHPLIPWVRAGTGVGQGCTVDAAVLVAPVQEVVLQDVQQARHLAEDEHPGAARLQPWQQLIQQHQLACTGLKKETLRDKVKGKVWGDGAGVWGWVGPRRGQEARRSWVHHLSCTIACW